MTLSGFLRHARPRYLLQSRLGRCTVCGRRAVFVVVDPKTIRENAWCIWCGSASRNRHLAKCVIEAFSEHALRGVKQLADMDFLRIYSMSAAGCLARVWGKRPHITYSEYFEGCQSGQERDGVLCQNVEQLSFADDSFDLVISEDVFEHVRDYRKGFAEVRRVLKPGGYHIFSVPIGFTHPTLRRFESRDGRDVPILPLESHADPIRGEIPVITSFGHDLYDLLQGMGFRVALEISRYDDQRKYGTFDSCTFVTRKP